jgi:hypothetical protein
LLANTKHLSPDQETHFKNKFSEIDYRSLCAALEQFIPTETPVDFVLEAIEIKDPSHFDEKIVNYLFISQQSFTQNASYNNWLSKHVTILSKCYEGRRPDALTDKAHALLITAIVWGINQAVTFANEHHNPKILRKDLPFDLTQISEASNLGSLDVNAKIQILLSLNEPLNNCSIKYERSFGMGHFNELKFCSNYPADIMKRFTSWEVMNGLVDKHPVFLNHLSNAEAVANLLKQFESDPEQARDFVKKHLAAFIKEYGSDFSIFGSAYLSGKKTATEKFIFLQLVLSQQDDCIPEILSLPDHRDYEAKAFSLLLIKTLAAYRAVWGLLYAEYRDSEKTPYHYYDVLAILIDRDEHFDFNSFCQLALNNVQIAFQFMQVKSERLQKYLEYKPEMVREIFKKHPQIISYIRGSILKAAFAQQENLIGLIPADSDPDYALQTLLAINTPSSIEKAKEQIRYFSVEKTPFSIIYLFREFNHDFIIHFLNESFSKEELKSVLTAEHLHRFSHEFQIKPLNTIALRATVEMADFLLEYVAEKTDFSPEEHPNYKPLQDFFEDCLLLLYQSKRITLEEIFSKYAHQILGENFRSYKTWQCELTIFLLEKIKHESETIIATARDNVFLATDNGREINDTALKNLIALLPQEINSRLYLQERDHFCYLSSEELDQEVFLLKKNIQPQATTEDTEKTQLTQKSDALFDSDYAVLRQGIHARYHQAMLEKTDDLSIVGDILADAKIAILTKLQSALTKINVPAESVQSVLIRCADESFSPSRLALEHVLKALFLEETVLTKLLDQCSDEVLPKLLQNSLKQLIFTQEKIEKQTPLIAFINSVYKDYPQGWTRVLLKVLEDYNTYPHEWIKGIVFALGILREPLGEKVLKMLDKIIKDAAFVNLSEVIHRQKMLFNRENFKRGHFKKPQRRVAEASQNLIRTHEKVSFSEFKS